MLNWGNYERRDTKCQVKILFLTVCKQVPFKKVCVSKSRSELVNCIFKYRIKGWQFKHAFASQKNLKLVQPPV